MAKFSTSRQKAALRKYARNIKYLMVVVSTVVIVFTLPKQVKFSYEIEKGRIWNQKDLTSPYNFAILKTPEEIENDKKWITKFLNLNVTLINLVKKVIRV